MAGLPQIVDPPGQPPSITSTKGVAAPAAATSTLLVKGGGAKIDSSKSLVLQLVETDIATGTNTQSTWGTAPQTASAQNVLTVASVLTGQNVGSRALVLVPATAAVPATAHAGRTGRPAGPGLDRRRRRPVLSREDPTPARSVHQPSRRAGSSNMSES